MSQEGKTNRPNSIEAATDVPQLISELDVGTFEHMLSVALSQTAAKVSDHDKVGEVNIKFKMEKISGTQQLRLESILKYTKPTSVGKSTEEAKSVTVLHVGKYGRLTIAPENQMSFLDRSGQAS